MKRQTTSKVREQSKIHPPRATFAESKSLAFQVKVRPPKPARRVMDNVSYDPTGETTLAAPTTEYSDLGIQGYGGGKLRIGLSGIGIDLHPETFAFRMSDDSLIGMHIRRGDVAIVEPSIDPSIRKVREGDLVLLRLDDHTETLRRITYCGNLMYFRADDNSKEPLMPAWQYAIYGIVTAVLRTFEQAELVFFPREETPKGRLRTSRKSQLATDLALEAVSSPTRLSDEPPKPGPSGHYVA